MFKDLVPMDEFFASIYADDILVALKAAGFEEIDPIIKRIAVKEHMRLKNFCNIVFIPERIYYLLYEMILGSYLETMYQNGKLPKSFDFAEIAGRVQIGDTSVELQGDKSINDMNETKLLNWIGSLNSSWQKEAITCRKIEW